MIGLIAATHATIASEREDAAERRGPLHERRAADALRPPGASARADLLLERLEEARA